MKLIFTCGKVYMNPGHGCQKHNSSFVYHIEIDNKILNWSWQGAYAE